MRAAAGVGGCAALDSFALEPNWLEITQHEVAVPGLPHHLVGFTIAHITDAYLTGLGRVEETIVGAVRNENVQLVALTGDIVDSVRRLPLLEELCWALRGDGRTLVATLGNWEHWGHIPLNDLHASYARSGAQLLVNDFRILADGVQVSATDDDTAGQAKLDSTLGTAGTDAKILLTHSPGLLDSMPRHRWPICGHASTAFDRHDRVRRRILEVGRESAERRLRSPAGVRLYRSSAGRSREDRPRRGLPEQAHHAVAIFSSLASYAAPRRL